MVRHRQQSPAALLPPPAPSCPTLLKPQASLLPITATEFTASPTLPPSPYLLGASRCMRGLMRSCNCSEPYRLPSLLPFPYADTAPATPPPHLQVYEELDEDLQKQFEEYLDEVSASLLELHGWLSERWRPHGTACTARTSRRPLSVQSAPSTYSFSCPMTCTAGTCVDVSGLSRLS